MNIGIYSGSFDPVHVGHLIVANYVVEFTDVDEVWFVVSPQNPFKQNQSLSEEHHRLKMVEVALTPYSNMWASDVEFSMPKPSYTIDTLNCLSREYPQHKFSLIIGADNWQNFDGWKSSQEILDKYEVLIYPRLGFDISIPKEVNNRVKILSSPIIEISSTFIREKITEGKSMQAWLPHGVEEYIVEQNLYKVKD